MAKIVVLEDDVPVCSMLKLQLETEGHDVRTALVGDEAIDLAHLFQPDVLITDWHLNGEYDGPEVAAAFKAAIQDIKTILISNNKPDFDLAEHGIVESIRKPFTGEIVVAAVERALATGSCTN